MTSAADKLKILKPSNCSINHLNDCQHEQVGPVSDYHYQTSGRQQTAVMYAVAKHWDADDVSTDAFRVRDGQE
jgi:hypothetical protein